MTLKALLKKSHEHDAKVAKASVDIETEKIRLIGNTKIRCAGSGTVMPHKKPYRNGCGQASALRNWTLRLKLFYSNEAYNEGWHYGQVQYDDLMCPKCGIANYTYNHPDKEKILELRKLMGSDQDKYFKEVTKYKRGY